MAKRYRFRFKRLDVYQAAVEHFVWTVQVVQRMPNGPYVVTNQFLGASLSIMGNIGEADGREKKPGEVAQHYRYAQGSTFESATHLDAMSAMKVISDDEYNGEEERLARIGSMLTRLSQRSRRERRRQAAMERRSAARRASEASSEDGTRRSRSGVSAANDRVELHRAGRRGAGGAAVDRTPRTGSPRERSDRGGSNLDGGSDRE